MPTVEKLHDYKKNYLIFIQVAILKVSSMMFVSAFCTIFVLYFINSAEADIVLPSHGKKIYRNNDICMAVIDRYREDFSGHEKSVFLNIYLFFSNILSKS